MAPGSNPEEGYAWFLGTQLRDKDVVVLVAEKQAAIVGYVYAGLEPQSWKELREACGFIHEWWWTRRGRRGGVATALIEAAAAGSASRAHPASILWTAQPNEAAQRLFERVGFRRTMVEMTREL